MSLRGTEGKEQPQAATLLLQPWAARAEAQRVEPAVGHRFYHTREKANGKALQRISVSARATWLIPCDPAQLGGDRGEGRCKGRKV